MANKHWDNAREALTGFLGVNFKVPKGETNRAKFPEARGVKVSVNLEGQSSLIRDICMLDEGLLVSGKYTEQDVLDAKDCIESDGLRVKLCKYLDQYMEGMTGQTGYRAMEIVNRNPGDEQKLMDAATNWVFDSTPVKRTITRDTRPLDEKLKDVEDQAGKIALIMKEMKISEEKAQTILPILEG